MNYSLLNKSWFKKHQSVITRFLRFPGISYLFSLKYHLKGKGKVVGMLPDMVRFVKKIDGKYHYQDVYYTDWVWSREMVKYFGAWFYFLHLLDKVIDPVKPEWSFGFNLFYPDPGTSGPTTDAYLERIPPVAITWVNIRSQGATIYRNEGSILKIGHSLLSPLGHFDKWSRAYMSFDTSPLSTFNPDDFTWYNIELYVTGKLSSDLDSHAIAHYPWNNLHGNQGRITIDDYGIRDIEVTGESEAWEFSTYDLPSYKSLAFLVDNKPSDNQEWNVNYTEVINMLGGFVTIAICPPEHYNPNLFQTLGGDYGYYASPSDAGASQAPRLTVTYITSQIVMVI